MYPPGKPSWEKVQTSSIAIWIDSRAFFHMLGLISMHCDVLAAFLPSPADPIYDERTS